MGGQPTKNPLGLPEEDVAVFRGTFDAFDADGGGSIDRDELRDLLMAFGMFPSEQELDQMIHEVDEDDSGEIEFDEFLRMVVLRMERNMMGDKDAVRMGFDVLDTEKTGSLNSETLEEILTHRGTGGDDKMTITTREVQSMIRAADVDNSGEVEFEELWLYAERRIKGQEGQRVDSMLDTRNKK
eukprot:TRINITY_DN6507_c0_g1_i1.p1 TRINITY_DN6507_c0_g1~~TRINITY_DN6507_c0_g1_i1.p1  ORF type:complete len:184 (+),score=63.64 TRINITY_DN6507_c0_g1_i1:191-742(+)